MIGPKDDSTGESKHPLLSSSETWESYVSQHCDDTRAKVSFEYLVRN